MLIFQTSVQTVSMGSAKEGNVLVIPVGRGLTASRLAVPWGVKNTGSVRMVPVIARRAGMETTASQVRRLVCLLTIHSAGCPSECSGNGECLFLGSIWHCACKAGRTGQDCSVPLELDCNDGLDNDSGEWQPLFPLNNTLADGLTDCDDPECCSARQCSDRGSCVFSQSPSEVLLRLPPSRNAPFAQVAFLFCSDKTPVLEDCVRLSERYPEVCGCLEIQRDSDLSGPWSSRLGRRRRVRV